MFCETGEDASLCKKKEKMKSGTSYIRVSQNKENVKKHLGPQILSYLEVYRSQKYFSFFFNLMKSSSTKPFFLHALSKKKMFRLFAPWNYKTNRE